MHQGMMIRPFTVCGLLRRRSHEMQLTVIWGLLLATAFAAVLALDDCTLTAVHINDATSGQALLVSDSNGNTAPTLKTRT